MQELSLLLMLAIMWGVVVGVYTVLFFPEIVRSARHEAKHLHSHWDSAHWRTHAPRHA